VLVTTALLLTVAVANIQMENHTRPFWEISMRLSCQEVQHYTEKRTCACVGCHNNCLHLSVTHWQSPNFYAYFPAQTSFPAILGYMLSSSLVVIVFSWVPKKKNERKASIDCTFHWRSSCSLSLSLYLCI
jgi:hypothetical protein